MTVFEWFNYGLRKARYGNAGLCQIGVGTSGHLILFLGKRESKNHLTTDTLDDYREWLAQVGAPAR